MQHHASLITADGAYHCPVGSIMAIFNVKILGIACFDVLKFRQYVEAQLFMCLPCNCLFVHMSSDLEGLENSPNDMRLRYK